MIRFREDGDAVEVNQGHHHLGYLYRGEPGWYAGVDLRRALRAAGVDLEKLPIRSHVPAWPTLAGAKKALALLLLGQ